MNPRRMPPFATMLVASALALSVAAAGANAAQGTWHVSPTGSDSANGSQAAPFRTIQRAVDIAAAGDTVRLAAGTYAGAGNAPVEWSNRGLVIESAGRDRATCVVECAGQDGFRFVDTNLADSHALEIAGITFAGADTAVAVLRTGFGYAPRVWASLTGCAARNGNVGFAAHGGWLMLQGCAVTGNAAAGVAGGFVFGLTMDNCVVRDNGTGLDFTQMNAWPAAEVTASTFVGNGRGIDYWQEGGGFTLRQCRIDSSTVGHGVRAASDFERLRLEDCDVNGNAGHGIANGAGTAVEMLRGEASGNAQCGVAMAAGDVALRLDGVRLAGNGGWGAGRYSAGDDKSAGGRGGFGTGPGRRFGSSPDKDPAHDVELRECEILANDLGGVDMLGAYDPVAITDVTVAGNGGPGLRLGSTRAGAVCSISRTTVVANAGAGLELSAGAWDVAQVLVTHNQGVAVDVAAGIATLSCSDLFGNLGGDWTGAIAGQAGLAGNLQADPLYCDQASGDYELREDSPAAAGAGGGGCGVIGRLGVGCPAPPTLVAPVPGGGKARAAEVHAAFPNPFNPRTTIPFTLAGAGPVRLAVYDVAGRHVRTLVDGALEAGNHAVVWDGVDERGLAAGSGVYLARLLVRGEAAGAPAGGGDAGANGGLVVRMRLVK